MTLTKRLTQESITKPRSGDIMIEMSDKKRICTLKGWHDDIIAA